MNREGRAKLARETLAILEQGFYYTKDGVKVDIQEDLKRFKEGTILYKPEDHEVLKDSLAKNRNKVNTLIEVTEEFLLFEKKMENY
ncbi:MAG: poly(ADP-ribose) glycohydrolase domain-containing protein [Promethearchaeota archaeon]